MNSPLSDYREWESNVYPTDFASSVISSLFIDHIVGLKNLHLSDFPLIQIQTAMATLHIVILLALVIASSGTKFIVGLSQMICMTSDCHIGFNIKAFIEDISCWCSFNNFCFQFQVQNDCSAHPGTCYHGNSYYSHKVYSGHIKGDPYNK